jgi:hypothetical protein
VAVEQVAGADEGGGEEVLRVFVDLPRRAELADLARLHDHDAVGDDQRLLLVVGDIEGGDAELLLDQADVLPEADPDLGVQCGERLVHQEHLGLDDEGPGQDHALLLAAGELVGKAATVAVETDQGQGLLRPGWMSRLLTLRCRRP